MSILSSLVVNAGEFYDKWKEKLETTEIWFYRWMLKIFTEYVTNKKILKRIIITEKDNYNF